MPEIDSVKGEKKFYEDVPMKAEGFFLKGAGSLDWGMKNRLSKIFNTDTGRMMMSKGFLQVFFSFTFCVQIQLWVPPKTLYHMRIFP